MKTLIILIISLCLPIIQIISQEEIFLKKSKVSDVIAFEKEAYPGVIFLDQRSRLSKSFYPLADKYVTTEKPIIAYRHPLEYLPVYAEYYYTPEDSIIRLTSYEWEKDRFGNVFKKQDMFKEENKRFETYNKEYERIKLNLIDKLGKPTSSDTVARDEKGHNNVSLKTRDTVWETDDYYASLDMIFGGQTFRIRLKHYWKN